MAVKIFNPQTQKIEIEDVCQEKFLEFLYTNKIGSFLLWTVFKRKFFSALTGLWADLPISKATAKKFIKEHNIAISDFKKSPNEFKNFNDFFTREIKPEIRPISTGAKDVLFPADARNLAIQNITTNDVFFAKNQKFNLETFFDDKELAKRFENGSMLISRLCPLDYHRFHYPVSGKLVARKKIGGYLYSVNPIALKKNLNYICENKRVVNLIELENGKMCAIVQIGATNVGSIVNFDKVEEDVTRGNQMGMFKFGGSCVITIFEKDLVKFDEAIINLSKESIEYLSQVNSKVGKLQ